MLPTGRYLLDSASFLCIVDLRFVQLMRSGQLLPILRQRPSLVFAASLCPME